MYAARVIESKIQSDPLILSELIQQAPTDPIRTPIVLATFHAWSKVGEVAVEKTVKSGWLGLAATEASSLLKSSAGLAAGSIGLKLTMEAVFGDISKYGTDPKKRAEMGAQLIGVGAGVGASSAVQVASMYLLRTNLTPHPGVNVAVKTVGGIAYFVTSDVVEEESKVLLRSWLEGKKLDEVIKTVQVELKSKVDESSKSCRDVLDIAQKLRVMREAHSKYRLEVMKPMIDFETRHLRNMVEIKRSYYQKLRLSEWLLEGSDKTDPDFKNDVMDWKSAKLGRYDINTDRHDIDKQELKLLVASSRLEFAEKIKRLSEEHDRASKKRYENLRSSLIFVKSFKDQLESQVDLIGARVPGLAGSVKQLKESLSKLFWVDTNSEKYRNNVKESIDAIKSAWLKEKNNLNSCDQQIGELLISDFLLVGNEFSGHLDMNYFKNLAERSEEIFLTQMKEHQQKTKHEARSSLAVTR